MAICPSHTFICIVQLTPLFLSLYTFQDSAGIPSGPIALPTFSASIAFVTSLSRITGPFESSSTSSSNSIPISSFCGFPFLSYRVSIYSFHLFLISSGSVNSFPVSSFIASLAQLIAFFLVNCPTFAYTKSGRALRTNSSNSLHSFTTIFLLLDLFLFSVSYLGADMFFDFLCIFVLSLPSLLHLLHYGCRYPWFSGNFSFQVSHISFSTFNYYPF